ncbi:MAG TPA: hypothetical protein VN947_14780 [Polyangia bacterium]|nr:hypothetical protein [Polyangia bacterium]
MRSHPRLREAQRRLPHVVAVAALALAVAGCRAPKPRAPLTTPTGAPIRLGWVTWSDVNEIVYCNQRLDDNAQRIGVLGPCWHETVGERPKQMMSWLNAGRPDATPPNAVPFSRCSVELAGDSHGASATLVTPTGREPIDDWKPDATVPGDLFADELSFSPEGKWMAVVHLGIHLGEGERIIEVHDVDIKQIPACR